MIKLDVPLVKQRTKYDCSVGCGLMLLKYYRKNVNYDALSSSIVRDKDKKVNIFELSISLNNFIKKINIAFFNYLFFNDENFIPFLKNLDKETISKCPVLDSIKKAYLKGINLQHKIFFVEEIEELIKNKKPIITLISVGTFRRIKCEEGRCHFIIITGFDDKYFYYNDPHWDNKKFGKHKKEKKRVIASIFRTRFPAILWVENES